MHEPVDVPSELHEALRRPRIPRLKLLGGVAVAAGMTPSPPIFSKAKSSASTLPHLGA